MTDRFAQAVDRAVWLARVCALFRTAVWILRQERSCQKVIREPKREAEACPQPRSRDIFERVVAAAKRLLEVVYKNEGLANKELVKFESQIQNLADKWDQGGLRARLVLIVKKRFRTKKETGASHTTMACACLFLARAKWSYMCCVQFPDVQSVVANSSRNR